MRKTLVEGEIHKHIQAMALNDHALRALVNSYHIIATQLILFALYTRYYFDIYVLVNMQLFAYSPV